MFELFELYNNLDLFVLVGLRVSGYILSSPFFGRNEVNSLLKISLIIYLTYILIFSQWVHFETIPTNQFQFIAFSVVEVLKGLLMGFMSSLFFSAFLTAGFFIDSQIGYRMGGLLDPKYGINTSLTANILNIIVLLVFLVLNGHLQMIHLLSHTYIISPIGNLSFTANLYNLFISSFSFVFLAAFKVALPLFLITFFVDVILVVMIKFMPQLNIFVIGIPTKLLVGLFSLFYIIEPIINFLDPYFVSLFENVWRVLL